MVRGAEALRQSLIGFAALRPTFEITARQILQGEDIAVHRSQWPLRARLKQRGSPLDDSIPQQFCHRVQLLHMLRHDLNDDDDGNAEQHSPNTP